MKGKGEGMKIIAMSDSHGSTYNMRAVMKIHSDADLFIHLGDGCEDFVNLCNERNFPYAVVKGNCDIFSKLPLEERLELCGKVIFMTHGHMHYVKSTTEDLLKSGAEQGADIILFGHTHEPLCEYIDDTSLEKPVYLINPGSIAQPRDGNPTYALIMIQNGGVLPNVAPLY